MMVVMHYRVVDVLFLRNFDVDVHIDIDVLLVNCLAFVFAMMFIMKEFFAFFIAAMYTVSATCVGVLIPFVSSLVASFICLTRSGVLRFEWAKLYFSTVRLRTLVHDLLLVRVIFIFRCGWSTPTRAYIVDELLL